MKKTNMILVLVMAVGVNLCGACLTCKGPFPGPSGSIFNFKPASLVPSHGRPTKVPLVLATGAGTEATASYQPLPTNLPGPTGSIHISKPAVDGSAPSGVSYQISGLGHVLPSLIATFPGPSGSIHDSKPAGACSGTKLNTESHSKSGLVVGLACNNFPGAANNCGSENTNYPQSNISGASTVAGDSLIDHTGVQGSVPSIHPQTPTGTYYINKPLPPSKDIEAPLISPSFSSQIPCLDGTCGSVTSNKDSVNHDASHQSDEIVYENEDGTYNNVPVTSKPIYKNSDQGGYAVSTDETDNSGVLVGPGTGHLPVESDGKLFGTQGAFGGSTAFVKGAVQEENKSFGTQGFGNLDTFIPGSTMAHTSGPGSGHLPVESDGKPFGTQGAFGGSTAFVKGAVQEKNKSFGTQGFGNLATFITGSTMAQTSGSFTYAGARTYAGSFAHRF